MTAIVGTLNKRGIAIAADSAATYSTSATNKITNNTNKIFEFISVPLKLGRILI